MVSIKALLSSQSLLLLSRGAFGQQLPQPNATVYIPAINLVTLAAEEVLLLSSVTTLKGSSTVYKVFDAKPTTTNTLTLILSPTSAVFNGTDHSLGDDLLDLKLNVTCSIENDNSTCNVLALISGDNTQTLSTVLSEPTTGIPVVALNFQPPATSSPAPSSTGASSGSSPAASPTPTSPPTTNGTSPSSDTPSNNTTTTSAPSSALRSQISIGSIAVVAFGLLFRLM